MGIRRIPGQRMASRHFSFDELACRCCGFVHFEAEALARLEALRVALGVPFSPSSACRCPIHNARVGGAALSQHRADELRPATAIDIPLVAPKARLIEIARGVGFRGLGVSYRTFLHVDNRLRPAQW